MDPRVIKALDDARILLSFSRGTAYISVAFIEAQEALRADIETILREVPHAAPNLLAALKAVVIECEKSGVSNIYENLEKNPCREPMGTDLGKALGAARAAIAKAEGVEP